MISRVASVVPKQPLVLEQLLGRGARLLVVLQTLTQKILRLRGKVSGDSRSDAAIDALKKVVEVSEL